MKIKNLVLIASYASLAVLFEILKDAIPFLNIGAFGGSIKLSLIPLTVASFHLGVINGLVTATVWFIVMRILGDFGYFLNFSQYALDYVIPTAVVSLSSIFANKSKKLIPVVSGIVLVSVLRFLSFVLAGIIFYAPKDSTSLTATILFAVNYNFPFVALTCLMLVIVVPILISRIRFND